MRITQRAVALTSLQGLNRNLDAVGKLQQQLTSGRLINAPSDSPTGTNRAMQTRARAGRPSPSRRATSATPRAGWTRPTPRCRTMLDTTRRVRDLTVQGLNTGALVRREPEGAGHRGRVAAGGPARAWPTPPSRAGRCSAA